MSEQLVVVVVVAVVVVAVMVVVVVLVLVVEVEVVAASERQRKLAEPASMIAGRKFSDELPGRCYYCFNRLDMKW